MGRLKRRVIGHTAAAWLRVALAGVALPACANTLSDAQLAYDNGEYEQAEALYKQAIEEGDSVDAEIAREELFELHMEQAKASRGKGKQQEVHYRKALALDPASGEAREGLARALVALYRHDDALAVVQEGVATGTCNGCQSMYARMLIQRADNQAEAGNWQGARDDYVAAVKVLPNPAVEMALARTQLELGKLDEAAASLKSAAPKIGVDAVGQRAQFLEVRRMVVLAALAADKIEFADDLLDIAPDGVSGAEQLGLAVEVAMEFSRLGKPADALSRMQSVVAAADEGRLRIGDARKAELRDQVADLLAARAAMSLAHGDVVGARTDINEALRLRPANTRARLQNVLLLAGEGSVAKGRAELGEIDKAIVGRTQIDAILHAVAAIAHMDAGKGAEGKREIEAAKAIDGDVPEVHVAEAMRLAATPLSGISKADAKALKAGFVAYPAEPTRAGEALSEISRARRQIEGQGDVYPYRGPDTIKRMQALESTLRSYYPFAVEFHKDPVAILSVSGKSGGAVSVQLEGAGAPGSVQAPAGGAKDVEIPRVGVVVVTVGGVSKALIAEPYTKVQLAL